MLRLLLLCVYMGELRGMTRGSEQQYVRACVRACLCKIPQTYKRKNTTNSQAPPEHRLSAARAALGRRFARTPLERRSRVSLGRAHQETRQHKLIERNPPPGGGFYLLCSLIKSRVYEISRRDTTVVSRRESLTHSP